MDKKLYRFRMRETLENEPNLRIKQAEVAALSLAPDRRVTGVLLRDGRSVESGAVIVTTGTFLNGLAHVGETTYSCGRNGEAPSELLGEQLRTLGLNWTRLKTGTPPRLDGRSIDWSQIEPQPGDLEPTPFSFMTERISRPQIQCHIGYTTAETRRILLEAIPRSPLYSGLSRFDYLSTVSGGGYIGGWLAAWTKRRGSFAQVQNRLATNRVHQEDDNEPREIRFLRVFSNYLTPKMGLVSGDTLAAAGIVLRNVLLNQLVLLTVLAALLLLPRAALRWGVPALAALTNREVIGLVAVY